MVTKSSPYTFSGPRPLVITAEAHVTRPLALAAFRRMTLGWTLRMLGSAPGRRPGAFHRHPDAVLVHDLPGLTVRSSRPVDLQLDGDHQGAVTEVAFDWLPDALPFLA